MRRLLALAVVGLGLAACGTSVEYECVCAATCDGQTVAVQKTVCEAEEEIQASVDAAVEECAADLATSCDAYGCACECAPTDEAC